MGQLLFSYSTNHGSSWSTPDTLDSSVGAISAHPETLYTISGGAVAGPVPAVASNGTVYVAWLYVSGDVSSGNSGQIRIRKISGGGTYIGPIDTVSNITAAVLEPFGQFRITSFPTIAVDQKTHYIYVAYVEYSSGPDYTVEYTYSTDSGSNWSTPAVATETTANWQFFRVVTRICGLQNHLMSKNTRYYY